jgi:hypothetical protein
VCGTDHRLRGERIAKRRAAGHSARRRSTTLLVAIAGLTVLPALAMAVEKASAGRGERAPSVTLYDDAGWNEAKQDDPAPCAPENCAKGDFAGRGGSGRLPEPASWALMLIGAGGVGALARRRRSLPSEA